MQGYGTLLATPGDIVTSMAIMYGDSNLDAVPFSVTSQAGIRSEGNLIASTTDLKTSIVGMFGMSNLYAMRLQNSTPVGLPGQSALSIFTTVTAGGIAWLQPLESRGGDVNYAEAIQYISPFYSDGNDEYVPMQPASGIAFLPAIVSWGYATGKLGEGNAYLPSFTSRGGDYNFSIGQAYLQPFVSLGIWALRLEEYISFRARIFGGIIPIMDQVIFINNQGQIVDTITAEREYLASLIEQATASGSISVLGQFLFSYNSAVSAQATLEANLEFVAGLAEALTATGSLTALGDYLASVNGDVTATGAINLNLQQLAELIEVATADGSLLAIADYFAMAGDIVSVSFSTAGFFADKANLDTSSRVWVVNMDTEASNQYDNYGFNSFFERNGQQYGVADDGIYLLDGNTDAGTDIAGLIETGRTNLGTTQKKSVVNVYAGVSSTGKMLLKVDADEQVYIYEARSHSAEVTNNRFDVGRGLSGVYFNFTLMNQNGSDFLHDTVTFKPVVLNRKI